MTPLSGCARASLAIQCRSCTSSASWASPCSTAASYKAAVRSTTCDQLPASRWIFTASIKASTVAFTDTAIPSTSFLFWLDMGHHLEPWQHRGPGGIEVEVQQNHDDHKDQPNQASISHVVSLLPLARHAAACAFDVLGTIDIQPHFDCFPAGHRHIATCRGDDDRLSTGRLPKLLIEINANDQLIPLD